MDVTSLHRLPVALLLPCLVVPVRADEPLPPGAKVRLGTTRLRHGGTVHALGFSPDGKRFASSGQDRVIRVWETRTGQAMTVCASTPTAATMLRFSPDGRLLAGTYYDAGSRIWDAETGKLRWTAAQPGGSACVAWAPDGKTLASAGQNGSVLLFETASGKAFRTLGPHPGLVLAVSFSPDGSEVLGFGGDHVIRRWDTTSGKLLRDYSLPREHFAAPLSPATVSFSPDSKHLTVGQGSFGLHIWSAERKTLAPRVLTRITGRPEVNALCWSADSKTLTTASNSGVVSVWDVAAGKERQAITGPSRLAAIALSADTKALASANDSEIRLWDAGSGKPLFGEELPDTPVRSVVFLDGGRSLVTLHAEGVVHAWDGTTGKHTARLPDACSVNFGLAVLDSGKGIRALGYPSTWIEWEPGGRKTIHEFPRRQGLLLSPGGPDGKTFLRAGRDGAFLTEPVTLKERVKLPQFQTQTQTLYFSPEGRRLAGRGTDSAMRVWDIETGQVFPSLGVSPHGPLNYAPVYLSPSGRLVAQVGAEIHVWEVVSGRERLHFRLRARPVMTAAFTPDSRGLVLGLSNGELQLINLDTFEESTPRAAHRGPVGVLRFSADGNLLASGSDDTTTLVWDAAGFMTPRKQAVKASKAELAGWWEDLADEDAAKAYPALRRLVDSPAEATALFREKLRPVEASIGKRIDRLVAALDDRRFATREKAMKELGELLPEAEPALRRALEKGSSLATRRRIEELLERAKGLPAGTRMRLFRAIEVLNRAGTPEARSLLKELAAGEPNAGLTREAKAALDRP